MLIKKTIAVLTAVGLSTVVCAQGNTFDKVRYNGGSVSTKVKPDDWNNKLTVTSEQITLALNDGQTVTIAPKQVTSLSYGQEAHRRGGYRSGFSRVFSWDRSIERLTQNEAALHWH